MPCCLISLPDIEQTVTRPTVYQVVKQIYEIAEIPKDTEILFAGKRGTMQTPGGNIEDTGITKTKFASSNLTFITVNEEYSPEAVQEVQTMAWDNRPIFLDEKLGLSLRPVYLPSKIEIEITFRHSSETEIRKWISRMMAKVAQGRTTAHLLSISYTFPVSHEFTMLLEDIHRLREETEGYGEDLGDYFEKHRTARMTTLSDQTGNNRHIVITEKQGQILGQFSFPVLPDKPEHLQEHGLWQGRFTFSYTYERPDQLFLQYPLSVHNQFLPEKYWNNLETIEDPQARRYYQSHSYTALQNFSLDQETENIRRPTDYIRIPSFDDFGRKTDGTETIFHQDTATVFTALSFLDTDKMSLLDLNELGDYYIDSDILEFLRSERLNLHKLYHSVFNISVYENDVRVMDNKIEVTADLMVKFLKPHSMRSRYHVRLSVVPSLTKPLYDALMRLKRYPRAFYKTIKAMNELLERDPDFNNWEKSETIKDWMFDAVWRVLNVSHQGMVGSPRTNIDPYLDEHIATIRNNFHLLTKLSPEEIKKRLQEKWRFRYTHMNAYLIANPTLRR